MDPPYPYADQTYAAYWPEVVKLPFNSCEISSWEYAVLRTVDHEVADCM